MYMQQNANSQHETSTSSFLQFRPRSHQTTSTASSTTLPECNALGISVETVYVLLHGSYACRAARLDSAHHESFRVLLQLCNRSLANVADSEVDCVPCLFKLRKHPQLLQPAHQRNMTTGLPYYIGTYSARNAFTLLIPVGTHLDNTFGSFCALGGASARAGLGAAGLGGAACTHTITHKMNFGLKVKQYRVDEEWESETMPHSCCKCRSTPLHIHNMEENPVLLHKL